MLFLNDVDVKKWSEAGNEVLDNLSEPEVCERYQLDSVRKPMFRFHVGCLLAAKGQEALAKRWFSAGAMEENERLMTNAFLCSFLDRHDDQFVMPSVVFEDPAPYIHFGTTPVIRSSRAQLIRHSTDSLPRFDKTVSYLDIGCGDGSLTSMILNAWRDAGVFSELKEITLVDASPNMLECAKQKLSESFDSSIIRTINGRIENVSNELNGHYEIAFSSLAFHHLPWELKIEHMNVLKNHFDHFIIFELDANNDRPELFTPELSASVYQSYGSIIDYVFQHDAPVETVQNCVDCFLMTELVSLMSEKRGKRNDYHMRRGEWHELFQTTLGDEFVPLADTTPYADEFLDLIMIHYGR